MTPAANPRGLTHQGKPRTCGLRFSAIDGAVLLLSAALLAWLWANEMGNMALLVAFTVGHFFLFCNVFRVRRAPELIWAAVFLANAGLSLVFAFYPFAVACAVQLPLTVFLLWRETRQPYYHGIAARRWNARCIDAYLRGEV